jgi:hypothetical protein
MTTAATVVVVGLQIYDGVAASAFAVLAIHRCGAGFAAAPTVVLVVLIVDALVAAAADIWQIALCAAAVASGADDATARTTHRAGAASRLSFAFALAVLTGLGPGARFTAGAAVELFGLQLVAAVGATCFAGGASIAAAA